MRQNVFQPSRAQRGDTNMHRTHSARSRESIKGAHSYRDTETEMMNAAVIKYSFIRTTYAAADNKKQTKHITVQLIAFCNAISRVCVHQLLK
jgi:hypothetical protein